MRDQKKEKKRDEEIRERIIAYWTKRSHDFAELREKERESETGRAFLQEIRQGLDYAEGLRILDVGCGTGIFCLMLSGLGHECVGIDLTEHMVFHARDLADELGLTAQFHVMDAERTEFADGTFDAVITRNLTWTLPHPDRAYEEWYRVLKKGGILLNFDADYGAERFDEKDASLPPEHVHNKVARELMVECQKIKEELSISSRRRPAYDVYLMRQAGFKAVTADEELSRRVYKKKDELYNPTDMFLLRGVK